MGEESRAGGRRTESGEREHDWVGTHKRVSGLPEETAGGEEFVEVSFPRIEPEVEGQTVPDMLTKEVGPVEPL